MELFDKKITELRLKSENSDILRYSQFLDTQQQLKAISLSRGAKYVLDGGYPDAERRLIAYLPSYLDELDRHSIMGAVHITCPHFSGELTHRDFLGAILGLGIKREFIGDIIISGKEATVVALKNMAEFIKENLVSVGRASVHVEFIDINEVKSAQLNEKHISCTVSQLRLDAVAANAFSLSRTKMCEVIDSGYVSVNHVLCTHRDKEINEGDVISVRGMGRAKLNEIGGKSRKDRIFLDIIRYV